MTGSTREPEPLLQKVLNLLQHLLITPDGRELYSRIDKGLDLSNKYSNHVQRAFIAYLDAQLRQYLSKHDDDTATRIVAKLVQRRLDPTLERLTNPDIDSSTTQNKKNITGASEALEDHIASVLWQATSVTDSVNEDLVDRNERPNLNAKRRDLESSQEIMEKNMSNTWAKNVDLLSNLRTIRHALAATSEYDDNGELREILVSAVDEIIDWQQVLADQLKENTRHLQDIRLDNLKLHKEIVRVRQLTLTDEFTGLPNRLAFMRRLNGEVSRARRYNYPISVCILAVDDECLTKEAKSRDQILKRYADDVVSKFRGYDMVARVGVQEFAVFLPNTDVDGAIRALTEAQNRADTKDNQLEDTGKELPSFSCGVAVARPQESAEELMQRAHLALKQAAQDGRRMLEISDPDYSSFQTPSEPSRRLH